MDDILSSVNKYYPQLSGQINRISNSKLDNFRTIQGSLFTIGTHLNSDTDNVFDMIPTKNYDEILTNIKWIQTKQTLNNVFDVVAEHYPDIIDEGRSIRKVVLKIITDILCAYANNVIFSLRNTTFKQLPPKAMKKIAILSRDAQYEKFNKIAIEIEKGILLYTLIIAGTMIKNVNGWYNEEFRTIYHSKANAIVCSLSNQEYCKSLLENMLSDSSSSYYPIELAFLKRSQLLPKLHERMYDNKIKYYKEVGLSNEKVDYKEGGTSTVKCHKCKDFYTDYFQLQTRSADEPMTIFYNCRKCGNDGRR